MFRLFRTLILLLLTFAAGILVGRSQDQSICTQADGNWVNGTCLGSDIPNE